MIDFHATSSKNNVDNELSVENYVDSRRFGPYPKMFLAQLKIRGERYEGRPAARVYPWTYNKGQPSGCNHSSVNIKCYPQKSKCSHESAFDEFFEIFMKFPEN